MVLVDTLDLIRFLANRPPYAAELDCLLDKEESAGHNFDLRRIADRRSGRTRRDAGVLICWRPVWWPMCVSGRQTTGFRGSRTNSESATSRQLVNGSVTVRRVCTSYSLRSAAAGSTRAARRAGSNIAAAATPPSSRTTPVSTRGSVGRIS